MLRYLLTYLFFQYILPAIVHINHQPVLEMGDGAIVSIISITIYFISFVYQL